MCPKDVNGYIKCVAEEELVLSERNITTFGDASQQGSDETFERIRGDAYASAPNGLLESQALTLGGFFLPDLSANYEFYLPAISLDNYAVVFYLSNWPSGTCGRLESRAFVHDTKTDEYKTKPVKLRGGYEYGFLAVVFGRTSGKAAELELTIGTRFPSGRKTMPIPRVYSSMEPQVSQGGNLPVVARESCRRHRWW